MQTQPNFLLCQAPDEDVAIEPILRLVRNGGELVVHNLTHETYVIYREYHKGSPGVLNMVGPQI